MAPPEALLDILVDFSSIEASVAANINRRVRLQYPKGVILCIGRRTRTILPDADGRPVDECARVAAFVCCSETFKFVGSIIPADSELTPKDRRRTRLIRWVNRRNEDQDSSSDESSTVRDVDNGVVGAACIAAAAVLGPVIGMGNLNAVYADGADIAYQQAPEVYVSVRGKIFIYMRVSRSEVVGCVAKDVEALVKDGICGVYLPVRRPIVCRSQASRELTECKCIEDTIQWRERNLTKRIVLGDKSELSACDQYFVGFDVAMMDRWAVEADTNASGGR